MPQQLVYGEDQPGLRWQTVTITILSWVALIGGIIATTQPHLVGLGVPAFIIGGFFALFFTAFLLYAVAVGVRVYDDGIQVGGLRGRDRRLRNGTWPPRKITGGSRKAVYTCPWQAADGLFVLTDRADIKQVRRDLRRFRRRSNSAKMALGIFDSAAYFADALLLISNDPGRTQSEPQRLTAAVGQYGRVSPVPSPTWLVPIRDPAAFQAAVRQLPQAPPVYDRLPEGQVRFEAS